MASDVRRCRLRLSCVLTTSTVIIALLVAYNLHISLSLRSQQDCGEASSYPYTKLPRNPSPCHPDRQDLPRPSHNEDVHDSRTTDGSHLSGAMPVPTNHACDGYDGILHIAMGDNGGAAGTVFFQFVVGQLLYAERYNLKPWIYFSNYSAVIYDEQVHGKGPGVTIKTTGERQALNITRRGGHFRDRIPGPPSVVISQEVQVRHFPGTGVWSHYFQPVSDFVPGDKSCEALPYVTLDLKQITPGIHGFAPWAPRCWRYEYLPDYVSQPHIPLHEWLEPHLKLGAQVVERYIRLKPDIWQVVNRVNPGCSIDSPCLGMHIRHSDKANGRRVIAVSEFLPYALAFVHEGGAHIYLATDSLSVLREINDNWPTEVSSRIRTIGDDVVRSSDKTPVFDIGAHDRTNREILIEIAALSVCQYFVHGLSAVSDSVLWLSGAELQARSVNLELPEHMSDASFGTLVQMSDKEVNSSHFPGPDGRPIISRDQGWWNVGLSSLRWALPTKTQGACEGYEGILLINSVSPGAMVVGAFFTDVVNQLLLAEKLNLIPWIHLGPDADRIYDAAAHGSSTQSFGLIVDSIQNSQGIIQGRLADPDTHEAVERRILVGGGIWSSYFAPVSDFSLHDPTCWAKPVASLDSLGVERLSIPPESVRAWRYDFIKDWPKDLSSVATMFSEMRNRGSDIARRYFKLAPYILERSQEVNPVTDTTTCLAVHKRHMVKGGKYRETVPPTDYIAYMQEFLQAGGDYVYLSTDSLRFLLHLNVSIPDEIIGKIRTQGRNVVRMAKKWPPDWIDSHHRVNSEVLVDIYSMSQCQLMVHSYSTVPEAVIYLNPSLGNQSVNLEKTDRMSPVSFGAMARDIVSRMKRHAPQKAAVHLSHPASIDTTIVKNATVMRVAMERVCRTNAVVYLAQKTHSSYQRDSYGHLLHSIELLRENYLSIDGHDENLDIFIFHTSDFDEKDLLELERQFNSSSPGLVRIIDLVGSPYWQRPENLRGESPDRWNAYPLFSEGYRRMIHFFAIDIWQFFADYSQQTGCTYRYIMRLDEDSYIHSPIKYDVFELMRENQYVYGFRMCSYEMKIIRNIWEIFRRKHPNLTPKRDIDYGMCGFYNNFFVADIKFFMSREVQTFLHFVDSRGAIYRRRLGDLLIHSTAVYAFAEESSIHRFLDFTYEHGTVDSTSNCLMWGGIQAGYSDPKRQVTIGDYYRRMLVERSCTANATMLFEQDLSPSYHHKIPPSYRGELSLHTITAGLVELPNKGVLSG